MLLGEGKPHPPHFTDEEGPRDYVTCLRTKSLQMAEARLKHTLDCPVSSKPPLLHPLWASFQSGPRLMDPRSIQWTGRSVETPARFKHTSTLEIILTHLSVLVQMWGKSGGHSQGASPTPAEASHQDLPQHCAQTLSCLVQGTVFNHSIATLPELQAMSSRHCLNPVPLPGAILTGRQT